MFEKKLENNRPFLKMAFEGFAGDGKTLTATMIAIFLHKLINSKKPIALYDTEKAFKALTPLFDEHGIDTRHEEEQRSLMSLNQAIRWCDEGNADILIVDSITHVWEEFVRAYMNRPDKNGNPMKRTRLEFQDWGVLKPQWKELFSTPFINAKCHIIFTGRAGYEYTDEKNEETGKREIYKSGIKMKAETETAFEPDILVLMQKVTDLLGDKKSISREATIIKDRTRAIDGKTFKYHNGDENKVFNDFYPALKILLDGAIKEAHGSAIPDTFEEFEEKFSLQAREREAMVAEIKGCFELMGLGTGAADKQVAAWTLAQVYKVNSIEMVSRKSNVVIKQGLEVIRQFAAKYKKYMNECISSGIAPDKAKVQDMMKEMIEEPAA